MQLARTTATSACSELGSRGQLCCTLMQPDGCTLPEGVGCVNAQGHTCQHVHMVAPVGTGTGAGAGTGTAYHSHYGTRFRLGPMFGAVPYLQRRPMLAQKGP